jgi:eukaryotic-like serine/threonine-protein kinase
VPGVAIGTVLDGKYRVDASVGRGGMAQVFAATHVALGNRVAVKVVLSDADEFQTERVMREARAAASLTSDHVTRVLDVGALESGQAYIVMELLDGLDLASLLEEGGPLSVPDAATYLVQTCEAVCEAHAQGIIHRDLKPSNLFLTRRRDGSPLIKLMDFGISKWAATESGEPLTSTLDVLGTPQYMAPEQIMSSRDVDARADVWALGALLYKLLTGHHPFEGPSPAAVLARVASENPPRLRLLRPDAPPKLERLVRRCLEKDPTRRLQTARAFARALLPYADDDTRRTCGPVFFALEAAAPAVVKGPRVASRLAMLVALEVLSVTIVIVGVARHRAPAGYESAEEPRSVAATPGEPPAAASASETAAPTEAVAPAASSSASEAPTVAPAGSRAKLRRHAIPSRAAHPPPLDPYGDRR